MNIYIINGMSEQLYSICIGMSIFNRQFCVLQSMKNDAIWMWILFFLFVIHLICFHTSFLWFRSLLSIVVGSCRTFTIAFNTLLFVDVCVCDYERLIELLFLPHTVTVDFSIWIPSNSNRADWEQKLLHQIYKAKKNKEVRRCR